MEKRSGLIGELNPPDIEVPEYQQVLRSRMVAISKLLSELTVIRRDFVREKTRQLSRENEDIPGSFSTGSLEIEVVSPHDRRRTDIDRELKKNVSDAVEKTSEYQNITREIDECIDEIDQLFEEIEREVCNDDLTARENLRRLYVLLGENVLSSRLADLADCSIGHVKRYEFNPEEGVTEYKEWAKERRDEQVRPRKKKKIIKRDDGCRKCSKEGVDELEVHHIIPVSQGGSDSEDNLAILCVDCHKTAHDSPGNGSVCYSNKEGFLKWIRKP
jgi:5-methylcytosine-specific restriction endonuclease McrA